MDHTTAVLSEQMNALKASGLADACDEIKVSINGSDSEALTLCSLAPEKAGLLIHHDGQTEIPTLNELRAWLPAHPGWLVFYHHTKGAGHPGNSKRDQWRHNMERVCVWDWKYCVASLIGGLDSCGAHWLTPEQFGGMVSSPYWGGNFWWATSDFLATLPPLPEDKFENRYWAESWIGLGPRRPRVRDYSPGWPA